MILFLIIVALCAAPVVGVVLPQVWAWLLRWEMALDERDLEREG
jgi:hypothetical protein